PPIDPLTAISAVRVFTRWQAAVASTMASRASGAGAPGPEGSFSSGAPQPVLIIATANTPRNPRTQENRETESVLYKAFFVRFVLSRVSGLPLVQPLLRRLDLPVDVPSVDVAAVAVQRAREGGDRVGVATQLQQQLAVMLLDDRVALQLIGGLAEVVLGQIEVFRFEVRPAEAVEIRAVLRFDLERLLQELHRFVEALAAIREHVAEIIQRRGVVRFAVQNLLEHRFGIGVPLLFVV